MTPYRAVPVSVLATLAFCSVDEVLLYNWGLHALALALSMATGLLLLMCCIAYK